LVPVIDPALDIARGRTERERRSRALAGPSLQRDGAELPPHCLSTEVRWSLVIHAPLSRVQSASRP
jgi:hypothetical protein